MLITKQIVYKPFLFKNSDKLINTNICPNVRYVSMKNRQSAQHCTSDICGFAINLNGKEEAMEWDFSPALNIQIPDDIWILL